ncbi:peptidase E [Micropruina sonneratiae]|uniref:Type 1 glutamine amidotransferase-like domain-containing protein n=1 Tax=Micropruina sonneratiae TaxID=2986940 RepID=UPI002227D124|nr:peptidase E [Micropruina sp. KQZ13P-5]MCW3157065.1 peptidase E [Micropruina sp. KQZ13P-5]
MTRHIVAMGGGGFSMSQFGEPTALDRYLIGLTGRAHPQVCFAPTAAGDDAGYIHRFLTAYGSLGVRTSVLTLWQDAAASIDRLAEADLLFVGGGSTVNLMALWEAHGVTDVIRQRYGDGALVLAGISAGACCWYTGCVTDSFGDLRPWLGGMGLVRGSFCPHLDGEPERDPMFTAAIAAGDLPGGYAADDGAGVHYVDGVPAHFIAEAEGHAVYRVLPNDVPGPTVIREPQQMTLLA